MSVYRKIAGLEIKSDHVVAFLEKYGIRLRPSYLKLGEVQVLNQINDKTVLALSIRDNASRSGSWA